MKSNTYDEKPLNKPNAVINWDKLLTNVIYYILFSNYYLN